MTARQMIAKARQHGKREGHGDYEDRANDVASGLHEASWAWPLVGADSAYINAVGTTAICAQIGIPEEAWEEVCGAWLDAFETGYKAARRAAVRS